MHILASKCGSAYTHPKSQKHSLVREEVNLPLKQRFVGFSGYKRHQFRIPRVGLERPEKVTKFPLRGLVSLRIIRFSSYGNEHTWQRSHKSTTCESEFKLPLFSIFQPYLTAPTASSIRNFRSPIVKQLASLLQKEETQFTRIDIFLLQIQDYKFIFTSRFICCQQ